MSDPAASSGWTCSCGFANVESAAYCDVCQAKRPMSNVASGGAGTKESKVEIAQQESSKLNTPTIEDSVKAMNIELFDAFLGHFGWFTFNLVFFFTDYTGNNKVAVFGMLGCVLAPLVSFLIFIMVKAEHLARKVLWAWLLKEHSVWVNFKNRGSKLSIALFYAFATGGCIVFATTQVQGGQKAAAIFGTVINGTAAYMSFYECWDFEASLQSINRFFLDSKNLDQETQMDTYALDYLRKCDVIGEQTLKMFCFDTVREFQKERVKVKSDHGDTSKIVLHLGNMRSKMRNYKDQIGDFQGFKKTHKMNWINTSFYATLLVHKPILEKDMNDFARSLRIHTALWFVALVAVEFGGFWAVRAGFVQ